jgi:Zn-dependent protease/CBS domain-containing protein
MKSWSIYLGRFFDIEVYIHWTFWILIAWIFLVYWQIGQDMSQGLWGVLFVLALFICVILHEFGHALTAKGFGISAKDITLYPIGGIARFEQLAENPGQELVIGLAGPAVNLVIALILWLYLSFSGQIPDMAAVSGGLNVAQLPFLWSLLIANLILAVFNLIPAFPMDGGRVFRSLLSFFTDRVKATQIAAAVGQALAIFFVFIGFFYNFWLVFIGLFIFLGASSEAAFEQTKSALKNLKVKDALIKRFTVIKPDDNLGLAADALLNSQETEFVVLDAEKPVGLITRNEIIKGLSEQGRAALVSDFMNQDFLTVDSEMKLEDFFRDVMGKGQTVALVLDGERLRGLIDSENVQEKILIQEALQRQKSHSTQLS